MPKRYGRATRAALERIKANHKILETAGVDDELGDKTAGELLVELSAFMRRPAAKRAPNWDLTTGGATGSMEDAVKAERR